MSSIFGSIFPKYQCGFQKGFSTQQRLIGMLEKWKHRVDKDNVFGALLTNQSKAFDCLGYEILIAKLNVHGFSLPTVCYMENKERKLSHLIVIRWKYYLEFYRNQY